MNEEAGYCPFCGSDDLEYLVVTDLNRCCECGKKFVIQERN